MCLLCVDIVHAAMSILVLHLGNGLLCFSAPQPLFRCETEGKCTNVAIFQQKCIFLYCQIHPVKYNKFLCVIFQHVYLSCLCMQDFKEQVIHHTATLILLSFSWISNYIRIGTLVMAVHDCSDILLEVSTSFPSVPKPTVY